MNSLELRLTEEELLFLTRLFKLPTLPGLDADATTDLEGERLISVLEAGERSLWARGMLAVQEDKRVALAEPLLAFVGTCVMATQVVSVREATPGLSSDTRLIHLGRDLIVEHALEAPGSHRLVGFVDRTALAERLYARLFAQSDDRSAQAMQRNGAANGHAEMPAETHDEREAPRFRVPQAALTLARAQAAENGETAWTAAATTLRQAGLDFSQATHVARSLAQTRRVFTFTSVGGAAHEGGADGMVLLDTPDGWYVLRVEPGLNPMVDGALEAEAEVRAAVVRLIGTSN